MKGEAIAFAGLYREWLHPITGEPTLSCSIITLPPHPKLSLIHSKAMPLMLPQGRGVLDMWLDNSVTNTDLLNDLLQPHLPQDLIAYQINKPSEYRQVGDKKLIKKDPT
ncbi:hypothetical protein EXT46_10950 [Pseudoalteromonas sp. CO325X]|nr:SOS response-associated peptidase family protein [Pseudoalteromonas sp. CO325X]RZF80533.1 hypothetical protein EXT46_10950 [Pseudoalteromonas sp. CO325X]